MADKEMQVQAPFKLVFPGAMLRQMWAYHQIKEWLDSLPPLYTEPDSRLFAVLHSQQFWQAQNYVSSSDPEHPKNGGRIVTADGRLICTTNSYENAISIAREHNFLLAELARDAMRYRILAAAIYEKKYIADGVWAVNVGLKIAANLEAAIDAKISLLHMATVADSYQRKVRSWMLECFGPVIAADTDERNHRFLEEAIECAQAGGSVHFLGNAMRLVQAGGCTQEAAHKLVDYVYGRPVGELTQEVGGCMVTLAALCDAHQIDMQAEGDREIQRIMDPIVVEKIRAKQKTKPAVGPLPGVYPERKQLPERTHASDEQLTTAWAAYHDANEANKVLQAHNAELESQIVQLKALLGNINAYVKARKIDDSDYAQLRAAVDTILADMPDHNRIKLVVDGVIAGLQYHLEQHGCFPTEKLIEDAMQADNSHEPMGITPTHIKLSSETIIHLLERFCIGMRAQGVEDMDDPAEAIEVLVSAKNKRIAELEQMQYQILEAITERLKSKKAAENQP